MTKSKKPAQDSVSENNTWDHVREIRRDFGSDFYTYLNTLDATWEKISTDYGEPLYRDRDEEFGSTPLEAFLMLIREGYFPPPEILIAVADCFEEYFVNRGEIELDKFFKGRIRGQGDFAAQRVAEHDGREFSLMRQINSSRNEKDRKNKTDLAIEYLQRMKKLSVEAAEDRVEAFVRQHDRLLEREKPQY